MSDHRDGQTDDDNPMYEWHGSGQICVCCGAGHEGTASFAISHWKQCAGIVAYGRMIAIGIDKHLAAVAARQLHRELVVPTTIGKMLDKVDRLQRLVEMVNEFEAQGRVVDPAFAATLRNRDRSTIRTAAEAAYEAIIETERRTVSGNGPRP